MKKNQIYGIVSIAMGALLFLPLLLAGYAGKTGGSESFFQMMGNFTASGTPTFYTIAAIFAIFTIIAAVALIAVGIMLVLGIRTNLMYKINKWLCYVAGTLGLIAGISAMLLALTYKLPIIGGKPFKVGIGSILLTILSVLILLDPLILKKVVKDKPAAPKTEKPQIKTKENIPAQN